MVPQTNAIDLSKLKNCVGVKLDRNRDGVETHCFQVRRRPNDRQAFFGQASIHLMYIRISNSLHRQLALVVSSVLTCVAGTFSRKLLD